MSIPKHYSSCLFGSLLLASLYAPFAIADYSMPEPQQSGRISFLTGGIGDEERTAMRQVKNRYNLSILSADASTGAYEGDTHITIRNHRGQELLSTDAGPLFYANVPPGRYIVEGTSEGQVRRQNVVVASDQPAHVQFRWK